MCRGVTNRSRRELSTPSPAFALLNVISQSLSKIRFLILRLFHESAGRSVTLGGIIFSQHLHNGLTPHIGTGPQMDQNIVNRPWLFFRSQMQLRRLNASCSFLDANVYELSNMPIHTRKKDLNVSVETSQKILETVERFSYH